MMSKRLFFFLSIVLFASPSCKQVTKQADHPAYHNPVVQPLTEALTTDPDNAGLYFQRAGALMRVKEDSLALLDLTRAVSLDSGNAKYLQALGMVHLEMGHPEKAIRAFQKNLKLVPGSVSVRLLLSDAYLDDNRTSDALIQIDKILSADPNHPGALFQKAKIQMAEKDTANAVSLLQRVMKLSPHYYSAGLVLGDWYAMQGSPQTISQYEKVFRMDTLDVTPLFRIGTFWRQQKELEKAKAAYRRCVLKDPDFSPAYYEIGKILISEDSVPKALRHFLLTIKTSPANADAYLQKGLCYEKLNQPDSARRAFQQALVFDSGLKEAQSGLKRLTPAASK